MINLTKRGWWTAYQQVQAEGKPAAAAGGQGLGLVDQDQAGGALSPGHRRRKPDEAAQSDHFTATMFTSRMSSLRRVGRARPGPAWREFAR
jgi:hypothetical protein